jgi:transforming growth factor-beta-induced protein
VFERIHPSGVTRRKGLNRAVVTAEQASPLLDPTARTARRARFFQRHTTPGPNMNFSTRILLPFCVSLAAVLPAQEVARTVEASTNRPAGTIVDVAVSAGSFKTLVAAVKAAGLVDALSGEGPLTVFAPTDEAFAKLPEGTVASLLKPENKAKLTAILTYHVVPGKLPAAKVVGAKSLDSLAGPALTVAVGDDGVQVSGARVLKTDVFASNGVIHVIDSVMLPPEQPTIVELAAKAGKFGTLLAAAKAAGLVDALNGDGPLTVFAPTDEAFAKLPEGTVASLLKPENKAKLAAILTYHVVPGRVEARAAITAGKAKTLQGQEVEFSIVDGRMNVNGAAVLGNDLGAKNGIVHVIDSVILPK